jgi:septal ring factor EnvC (AmiA/AmiB activator)
MTSLRLLWIVVASLASSLVLANTAEQTQLEAIKAEIATLTARIQDEQQQRDIDVKALMQADELLAKQSSALQATARQITRVQEEEAALQARFSHLLVELAQQREHLAEQVIATWKLGRQHYLKFLLRQDDPARLSRMLAYYDYFNQARVAAIEALRDATRELDEVGAALAFEQQQLQALGLQQEQQLVDLEASREIQLQLIAHWNAAIGTSEEQLIQLRENATALDLLISQIDLAIPPNFRLTGETPFANRKGRLLWPVEGQISKGFGQTLVGEVLLDGVIIALSEGTPVRVVHPGRVLFADWLRGYGMLVIVEHDAGYLSLYGYNQQLMKQVGDRVLAGEVVALSGRSGGQQQASLYFAIRKDARSLDPAQWCVAMSTGQIG